MEVNHAQLYSAMTGLDGKKTIDDLVNNRGFKRISFYVQSKRELDQFTTELVKLWSGHRVAAGDEVSPESQRSSDFYFSYVIPTQAKPTWGNNIEMIIHDPLTIEKIWQMLFDTHCMTAHRTLRELPVGENLFEWRCIGDLENDFIPTDWKNQKDWRDQSPEYVARVIESLRKDEERVKAITKASYRVSTDHY